MAGTGLLDQVGRAGDLVIAGAVSVPFHARMSIGNSNG